MSDNLVRQVVAGVSLARMWLRCGTGSGKIGNKGESAFDWRYRRRPHDGDTGLRAFLSSLRQLRTHGAALAHMPPEVIAQLDAAIDILVNANILRAAGLELRENSYRGELATKSHFVTF